MEAKSVMDELDHAFYNDGYSIASEHFEQGINRVSVIKMTKALYSYFDQFTAAYLQKCESENKKIDCKKGCGHCCHQSVFMLPHEAWYLFRYIKLTVPAEQFNSFKDRILNKDKKTSRFRLIDVLKNTEPCPFLTDNICSVYEARPMACRLFESMDVESCIAERKQPMNFNKFAKLYDLPLRVGRMINEGVCAYFTEKGLKTTEWILESHMTLLFQNENIFNDWVSGKEIFKRRELENDEWKLLKKYDRLI